VLLLTSPCNAPFNFLDHLVVTPSVPYQEQQMYFNVNPMVTLEHLLSACLMTLSDALIGVMFILHQARAPKAFKRIAFTSSTQYAKFSCLQQ
jgi:hypothetical protein